MYDKEGDPAEVQKLRNALASVGVRPITIDRIATAHNRPTYVAQTLSLLVSRSSLSEQKKTEMDRVITQLMSTMGQCERLRQQSQRLSQRSLGFVMTAPRTFLDLCGSWRRCWSVCCK